MVLRLLLYIADDGVRVRLADREGAVSRLPVESRQGLVLGLQPFGGAGLHRLDDLGERQGSRQAKEEMDVVLDSAHLDRVATVVVQDGREVGVQFRADLRWQDGVAVLRAENQVDQNTG